ncbi:MAG: hypothetical protein HGA80_07075 [Candidatus Omnitrophica bacterium]|nr:hypothetical protein [Candidatus Omnitrophota bacterium]
MSLKSDLESALVDSVRDSFRTVMNVELEVSDPAASDMLNAELICTIGTAGKLEGSLSVSVPETGACAIVSRMLQDTITRVTPDVCDGMRELANMVAGGLKLRVANQDCSFDISIPTVVQGRVMHITVTGDVDKIIRRFSSPEFVFDVEFIFKLNHDSQSAQTGAAKAVSKASALERLKAMTAKASGG